MCIFEKFEKVIKKEINELDKIGHFSYWLHKGIPGLLRACRDYFICDYLVMLYKFLEDTLIKKRLLRENDVVQGIIEYHKKKLTKDIAFRHPIYIELEDCLEEKDLLEIVDKGLRYLKIDTDLPIDHIKDAILYYLEYEWELLDFVFMAVLTAIKDKNGLFFGMIYMWPYWSEFSCSLIRFKNENEANENFKLIEAEANRIISQFREALLEMTTEIEEE